MGRKRNSVRTISNLIAEIRDYIDYRRGYVEMNSPEAEELGRAYHDHKIRVRNAGKPRGLGGDNAADTDTAH